jgi:hypothetical protein
VEYDVTAFQYVLSSVERLRTGQVIAAYNPTAHPFEWTKEIVHPKSLKRHYADLCN